MRRKSWLGLAAGCLAIAMLVSGCAVTDFVQSVVRQAADFFPDLAGSAPRGSLELDGRTIAQADVAAYAGPWDAVITPYYRQQLTGDEALVYDRKPKTLSELEKLMGKAEFAEKIGGFVTKPLGKPTLAPASDKREAYAPAAADFAGVVDG